MKVKEVIDLINNEDELYHNSDAEELLNEHNIEQIAYGLNVDRHRWYEIITDIYKCEDGYVGITGVGKIYSEMMSSSDCDVHCYAEEYEPIQTITYKRKVKQRFIMENIIKWRTGFPDIEGEYLITEDNGEITTDCWCVLEHYSYWVHHRADEVVAWYKLSEIEPYKA